MSLRPAGVSDISRIKYGNSKISVLSKKLSICNIYLRLVTLNTGNMNKYLLLTNIDMA